MLVALILLLSAAISTALIPPLIRAAGTLGLVDHPNWRKVHEDPIPTVGGIAIASGAVLSALAWLPLREDINGFLLGTAVLLVAGVWDDRSGMHYSLKFVAQIVAAVTVVWYGGVVIDRLPFLEAVAIPGYVGFTVSVIALVAITNAINLWDGLDGLAGGTTLIAIGLLGSLAYLSGDGVVTLLATALCGAILGFLRFNTYPARVFMGDTGSQFLGFGVGVIAIMVTQTSDRALSPMLPLLVLGLPILDTSWVCFERVMKGLSPFKADRNHIHHKILGLGFNQYEAVLTIYALHK